jgi:hypothetical protein
LTFTFVRLLQVVGLAWEVVPVKVPAHIQLQDKNASSQETTESKQEKGIGGSQPSENGSRFIAMEADVVQDENAAHR